MLEIQKPNFHFKIYQERPDSNFEILSKYFPPSINRYLGFDGTSSTGEDFSFRSNFLVADSDI